MHRLIGAVFPRFGRWLLNTLFLLQRMCREFLKREGVSVLRGMNGGLLVLAEFEDSVLISKDQRDEVLHYQFSDVFELFLKPDDEPYYWEMYATPFGNKSTLFFPSDREGKELVNDFLLGHPFRGLEVSSQKSSKGWNAQMWVPVEQLTALGAAWGTDAAWRVFCGRYNYNSDDLDNPELSMTPIVSTTNYHLTEEYAYLSFCK